MSKQITWHNSPWNQKDELRRATFPSAVYGECAQSCINNITNITSAEKACYSNCYAKHSAAFDLFIDVNQLKEINKELPEIIDIGGYVGYSIENKSDTLNKLDVLGGPRLTNNDRENACPVGLACVFFQ